MQLISTELSKQHRSNCWCSWCVLYTGCNRFFFTGNNDPRFRVRRSTAHGSFANMDESAEDNREFYILLYSYSYYLAGI